MESSHIFGLAVRKGGVGLLTEPLKRTLQSMKLCFGKPHSHWLYNIPICSIHDKLMYLEWISLKNQSRTKAQNYSSVNQSNYPLVLMRLLTKMISCIVSFIQIQEVKCYYEWFSIMNTKKCQWYKIFRYFEVIRNITNLYKDTKKNHIDYVINYASNHTMLYLYMESKQWARPSL